MAKLELKGLKGINDLSNEDYQTWRAAQVSAGKLNDKSSWDYEDRLYRNQKFISDYGMDAFMSMSPDQRDQYNEAIVTRNAILDKFRDEAQEFLGRIDIQGLQDLYSRYTPTAELDAEEEAAKANRKKLRNKEFSLAQALRDAIADMHGQQIQGSVGQQIQDEEDIASLYEGRRTGNQEVLSEIMSQSDMRRAADPDVTLWSNTIADAIMCNQSIKISDKDVNPIDYINNRFQEIGMGSTETVTNQFGDYEVERPGSNYYKAFADSDIIKNMPIEDKRKLVASYDVLSQKYGETLGSQIFDTLLQKYISDSQSGWQWLGNDIKNIVGGGVANIMNKVMGVEALGIMFTQGEEALTDFLNGYDENGNLKGWFFNPQYWNGVDQYNVWSPESVEEAHRNGGITSSTNIYTPGTEAQMFSWQTANEALRMGKFIWSDYLVSQALGAGAKGITKGITKTGSTFKRTALGTQKFATGVERYVTRPAIVAASGVGISEAYGIQTFDATRQELEAKRDERMYNEVERLLSEDLMSEDTQARIEELANKEIENRRNSSTAVIEGQVYNLPIDENAIRLEVANAYSALKRQQLLEDYKNSDQYIEESRKALEYATDAYIMDATMEELRMSVTNSLWGQYKFDKGTRAHLNARHSGMVGLVGFAEDGSANAMSAADKALYRVQQTIKPIWDGFQSNYLDDVTVGFAKGFGIGEYNNYIAGKYNTEQRLAVANGFGSEFLAGLEYASREGKKAMADPQSWYDGWIGLVGSVSSVAPRISKNERPGVKFDKNTSRTSKIMQTINNYINNPLLDSYYTSKNDVTEMEETIDRFNKNLAHNRPQFEDIYNMVAINQRLDMSKYGDMIEAKDAKVIGAIELMQMLEDWSNDPVLKQSKAVQQYQQDLQKALSGDKENSFTKKEKDQLVAQYLARNPGFMSQSTTEERYNAAFEKVQENITKMNEYWNSYKENYAKVNQNSTARTPEEIKAQLAKSMVMEEVWNRRLKEMENEVSGMTSNYGEATTTAEFYGSFAAMERARKKYQDKVDRLNKNKELLEKKLEDAKSNPFKRLRNKIERKSLSMQIEAINSTLENLELRERIPENLTEEDFKNLQIYTADEIRKLHPAMRARMLSHPEYYSKAQQAEIKRLINQLETNSPDVIQMIKDIPVLMDRVRNSEDMRNRLSNKKNAEAASYYLEKLSEQQDYNIDKATKDFARILVNATLGKTKDEKELITEIWSSKGYNSTILNEFFKEHPDRKTPAIEEVLKVVRLSEDASSIVNELFNTPESENTRKLMLEQVVHLIRGSKNVNEAINNLEKAIDTTQDAALKSYLDKILDRLATMQYQRNAVMVEARKQKTEKTGEEDMEATDEPTNTGANANLTGVEDVDLGELSSPSIEEQADAANSDNVQAMALSSTDGEASANNLAQSNPDLFPGNPFMEYDTTKLDEEGKLEHKQAKEEGDAMDQFYQFLRDNGIQMQEIIDNELGNILRANPEVPIRFMFTKPNPKIQDHNQKQVILAIELTPEIAKFHDSKRGTIHAGDADYIVIGSLLKWGNLDKFNAMTDVMKRNRKQYFDAHPEETLYVDGTFHTQIHEMTGGYKVKQLEGDSNVEFRDIADLATGEVTERNPEGLSLEDLKWGISIGQKLALIGVNSSNTILPPKYLANKDGSTFLFIKAANGTYIPIYVQPTKLSELRDGSLKNRINDALIRFTSPVYAERIKAREELKELLSFNNEKTLLTRKNSSEITVQSGESMMTFNISQNFDRAAFMQAIEEANFRVNITVSALQSPSRIKELSDAGALRVDIAKLGTSNAIFDVYACKEDGTPDIKETAKWSQTPGKEYAKKESTVWTEGRQYHSTSTSSGVRFYDSNGKLVEGELAQKLAYAQEIMDRNIPVAITLKGRDFYILREGENPLVVEIKKDNKAITILNPERSKNAIQYKASQDAEAKRAEAAKNKLTETEPEHKAEEAMPVYEIEDGEYNFTSEELAEMMFGTVEDVSLDATPVGFDAEGNKVYTFEEAVTDLDGKPIVKEVKATDTVTEPKSNGYTVSSISENNLHNSGNNITFAEIYGNRQYKAAIKALAKEKGWTLPSKISEIATFLANKGIAVEGITDFDSWFDMVKNCRN